jgi:uncharacterized protein
MNPPRMRPRIDDTNRAFWTGGAEGKLNIQQCGDCGHFNHPPLQLCRKCQSENLGFTGVSGTGIIDTFTVNHQQWYPGVEVPYVIARVRLDDAPNVIMTTNIAGCGVDDVAFDDKVRVVFDEQDGIWFPLFEKAD